MIYSILLIKSSKPSVYFALFVGIYVSDVNK
jgi:hypothetical protein